MQDIQLNYEKIYTRMEVAYELFIHSLLQLCFVQPQLQMKDVPKSPSDMCQIKNLEYFTHFWGIIGNFSSIYDVIGIATK